MSNAFDPNYVKNCVSFQNTILVPTYRHCYTYTQTNSSQDNILEYKLCYCTCRWGTVSGGPGWEQRLYFLCRWRSHIHSPCWLLQDRLVWCGVVGCGVVWHRGGVWCGVKLLGVVWSVAWCNVPEVFRLVIVVWLMLKSAFDTFLGSASLSLNCGMHTENYNQNSPILIRIFHFLNTIYNTTNWPANLPCIALFAGLSSSFSSSPPLHSLQFCLQRITSTWL